MIMNVGKIYLLSLTVANRRITQYLEIHEFNIISQNEIRIIHLRLTFAMKATLAQKITAILD